MKQNSKKNNDYFLQMLGRITLVIFLISTFSVCATSKKFSERTDAATHPIFGNNYYEVVDDIVWSRTQDVRGENPSSFKVNKTFNNGDLKSFNTNYWTIEKDGTYFLNKIYNPVSGIIWMPYLFPYKGEGDIKKIKFDYNVLKTYLNPENGEYDGRYSNVWDGKRSNPYSDNQSPLPKGYVSRVQKVRNANGGSIPTNYPNFATWQYCAYGNSFRYGEQLRLFRGEFELTEDDVNNYDFFLTTGENLDFILPVDDTMIVLVDEEPTGINYTSAIEAEGKSLTIYNENKIDRSDDGKGNFNIDMKVTYCTDPNNADRGYKADCTNSTHAWASAHTDGLHAHLDEVQEDGTILGDVTDIIKANSNLKSKNGNYNHKIEILCSDYNISGGMTELKLVKVKKPIVEVEKKAYLNEVSQDSLVASGSSETTGVNGEINTKGTIYYSLSYSNSGTTTIKNVEFYDKNLGIKITKDGFYYNDKAVEDLSTLTITKGSVVKTGSSALELLRELDGENKITITDTKYLKEVVETANVEETITNTVKVNSYYLENNTEVGYKEATVNIDVVPKIELDINKSINTIVRDNKVIYDSEVNNELPDRIYTGDKIQFKFELSNNGITDAVGLSLKDIVKTRDGKVIINNNEAWTFTNIYNGIFDASNFNLPGGSKIELFSNVWEVPENARYITTNTIELYKNNEKTGNVEKVDESSVDFVVYPKIYVNMVCKDDTKQEFYVTITGDNGFKTGMYLKDGDKVEVDNLDFGVNYTVTEIIPMNCTLEGMDLNEQKRVINHLEFNLMDIPNLSNITIVNSKEDSTQYKDKDEVTNNLNFSK